MFSQSPGNQTNLVDTFSIFAVLGVAIGSVFVAHMSHKPKPVQVKVKPQLNHDVVVRQVKAKVGSYINNEAGSRSSKQDKKYKHHVEQVRHRTGRQKFASKQEGDRRGCYTVRFHKPKQQVFVPAPAGVIVNPVVVNRLLSGK